MFNRVQFESLESSDFNQNVRNLVTRLRKLRYEKKYIYEKTFRKLLFVIIMCRGNRDGRGNSLNFVLEKNGLITC